jgi:rod shape-determining protein MreC
LNKQQAEQINKLIVANTNLKMVDEENNILREQLGFFAKNKYKHILSNVIFRGDIADISGQTETIIIDKGSRDGLSPGLPVLSSEGIIVGKIAAVKDNIAEVYLTNNPKCKLAATILSQTNTTGIAEGELGLTIKMNFIPQNINIAKNNTVITSGLEKFIPRGLVIGNVIDVYKENNELWQTATIEPLVNGDDLIIVSIIMP